ncbi:MAG TPA: FAD-binding oxidoreductase [Dehalococcoidales bacterium]|nr:MAG: hypothetical protein A2Z05_00715 [Chloroflexi bacterium RBG_16_60_22]HJX13305.1 FAD-binding oxidoreductase [Dehalococcoidales bacterium]
MEAGVKGKVQAELEKIVGGEYVSASRPDLYSYSRDMSEHEPAWPDFVVMPDGVAEIQGVLRLANREKIAVIPYTAGDNVGGLTLPLRGGIILDLKRMNRLIEFNEPDRYIVVEPGYNFGDLRRLLDRQYPHLWYSFPGAPGVSSLMSNALLMGFGRLTNVIGTNAENVNGLEAVLPTGEVVKIGSAAVTSSWANRAPLPDLAGLFLGWQGATGVVTKISVQLWPRHPFKHIRAVLVEGIRPACNLARRLAQTRVAEIIEVWTFEDAPGADKDKGSRVNEGKQQGAISMRGERTNATYDRPPGPDTISVVVTLAADSEEEMKAKQSLLDVIIRRELKGAKFRELPREMVGLIEEDLPVTGSAPLGGLTWVGSMGPTSRWAEALEKIYPIYDRYRLRRAAILAPFRSGHYGMLRLVVQFYKGDPDEVERVGKCMREILEVVLDHGFIPYKAPAWAVAEMMKRSDPGWAGLLARVKKMLDPNDIMNPGRYGDTGK